MFDWENAIALDKVQGNRASSRREGKVSWVFSSCQSHVRPLLEMKRRPRAFGSVSTGDSDSLSSFDMNDQHVSRICREICLISI